MIISNSIYGEHCGLCCKSSGLQNILLPAGLLDSTFMSVTNVEISVSTKSKQRSVEISMHHLYFIRTESLTFVSPHVHICAGGTSWKRRGADPDAPHPDLHTVSSLDTSNTNMCGLWEGPLLYKTACCV